MSASDERLEVRDGGSRDQSRSGSGRGGLDTMPRPADGDPLPSAPRGGSGSSSGFSGGGNPFVASKEDSTTPLAGSGVLDDIEGIATGLKEGSWLDVGMSTLAMGADVLGAVVDPLGTLIAWGAGWLIEHFNPMKGWLEQLAGDADQVKANAQTWGNVAEAMGGLAEDLEMDAKGLMADARGAAAMGYLAANGDVSKSLRTAGKAAAAMSGALGVLAVVNKVVHDLVRDAIAAIIGTLASAIIEAVATVGFAIPAIIAQVQIKVGAKAAEMGAKITGLLKSAKSLFKQLTSLKGLLELLKSLLKKGKQGLKGLKNLVKSFGKNADEAAEATRAEKFAGIEHGSRRWDDDSAAKSLADNESIRQHNLTQKRKLLADLDADLRPKGYSSSDLAVPIRTKTLKRMDTDPKVSTLEQADYAQRASDLTKARCEGNLAAEQMGQTALEYHWEENGIHVVEGVGGTGVGPGHVDGLGISKDGSVIHVGEAKGGDSKLKYYDVEGKRVKQGDPWYVGNRLTKDGLFQQKMADNIDIWDDVVSGRRTLSTDVAYGPDGTLDSSSIEMTPMELSQHHMDILDDKIRSLAKGDAADG